MRGYLNSLIAVAAALVFIILLLLSVAEDPFETLIAFMSGPFSNTYLVGNMLATAAILIIAGAGMSISFQAGLFNLGGEGQIYTAGTAAAVTGLLLPPGIGIAGMVAISAVGISTGALIAALSGYLRAKFRVHELISTFLLSSALVYLINFLIAHPLRNTSGFLQSTRKIPEAFHLSSFLEPSNLTAALPIALTAAVLLALWLYRSPPGYELRVSGSNPAFANFGRISRMKCSILPLAVSGGAFGLAGSLMVLSTQHAAIVGFTSGYGWNGIAVALIARRNPLFAIPAGLLMAWLETGIRTAMSGTSLGFQLSTIIRGLLLLLITMQFLKERRAA
ncbi:MAG: ABC transporter permease [Spirochaetota bacterium]